MYTILAAERVSRRLRQMCNLYSITTDQEAIRALLRVVNRYVGNLAPMPGVFPDYPAPVIRNIVLGYGDKPCERTLSARVRWSNGLGAARSKSISDRGRQLPPGTRQRAFYRARLHFRPLWAAQVDGH